MTGSMSRHPIRIDFAAAIIILAAAIAFGGGEMNAQSAASPFDGRWVIPADPWFDRLATTAGPGRGGRGAAGGGEQAPGKDVVLELRVAPGGAVSGRAAGISGRRGAPGSHPAQDVEITRGSLKGDALTFQIWQFDGFHNRVHATATVADGGLELEFRRDTAAGPETFKTHARRATY